MIIKLIKSIIERLKKGSISIGSQLSPQPNYNYCGLDVFSFHFINI